MILEHTKIEYIRKVCSALVKTNQL